MSATQVSPCGYSEIDEFRRYCVEKNKEPLEYARACFLAARAYTDALADAGEVEAANKNIEHEMRWRGIYEVLSGGELPEDMK